MSLAQTFKKEMPIDRVQAECGECGIEFFDSMKSRENSPNVVGDIITLEAETHRIEIGHDDLQVNLDKSAPVKEIDATVTVNG